MALSKEEKKTIQSNLAAKEYYKSAIHGLYSKNNDAALKTYNKEFLNDADLEKEKKCRSTASSSINGVYGHKTEQGFINFQNIQDA